MAVSLLTFWQTNRTEWRLAPSSERASGMVQRQLRRECVTWFVERVKLLSNNIIDSDYKFLPFMDQIGHPTICYNDTIFLKWGGVVGHLCCSMRISPTAYEKCKHTKKAKSDWAFWHSSTFCEWKVGQDGKEIDLKRPKRGQESLSKCLVEQSFLRRCSSKCWKAEIGREINVTSGFQRHLSRHPPGEKAKSLSPLSLRDSRTALHKERKGNCNFISARILTRPLLSER